MTFGEILLTVVGGFIASAIPAALIIWIFLRRDDNGFD